MAFLRGSRALLALFLLLAPGLLLTAGGLPPSADEVKAAFICNFAEFVEWPAAKTGSPVVIGIYGEDPFGRMLDEAAAARSSPDRRLEVRRVKTAEEAAAVAILFIGASAKDELAGLLPGLEAAHVLTVGDLPRFAARGGVVGLLVEDKRVRLEVNAAAAGRAGLTISSRLLNLARLVEDEAERGD